MDFNNTNQNSAPIPETTPTPPPANPYITPSSSKFMHQNTPPQEQVHGRKVGPIIAALIIVILLSVAALYFWGHSLNSSSTTPATSEQTKPDNQGAAASNSVKSQATASSQTRTDSQEMVSIMADVDSSDGLDDASF